MRHTLSAISFVPRTNDGAAECSCGWTGQASEYSAHRKDVGARFPASTIGPRIYDPKSWNRQYKGARA